MLEYGRRVDHGVQHNHHLLRFLEDLSRGFPKVFFAAFL